MKRGTAVGLEPVSTQVAYVCGSLLLPCSRHHVDTQLGLPVRFLRRPTSTAVRYTTPMQEGGGMRNERWDKHSDKPTLLMAARLSWALGSSALQVLEGTRESPQFPRPWGSGGF